MVHLAVLIALFPLAGFVTIMLAGRRLGDPAAGWLASAAVGASFVMSVLVFAGLVGLPSNHRQIVESGYSWISVGALHINAGLLIDPLSITMALFVTGIAALIHIYSTAYMKGDPQYTKFFLYLNLFVFSMLVLVLASNLVVTFVGWEGVAVCSYWLVSFWFDRPAAASAGKKAFLYNRVGDIGFLLGTFLLFQSTGHMDYRGIFSAIAAGKVDGTEATAAALLLFLGAAGKSAQLPLFPWLVDAMEGPTPVSALIHAATMVTAGVYLMTRMSPLLALSSTASLVIAIVGVLTAFIAGTAACAQSDIKKVLAFSTVSQLGYMFLAIGARAYVAAVFLMVAHAFYKALLFLGAGSVIHGLHHEQDLKKMGGLRRYMPVTAGTFVVAWLAIGGVPPLAGFWAKGDVLLNTWADSHILWALAAITAVLTAYYVGRETVLVFYGPEHWHKSPAAAPVAPAGPVAPATAVATAAGINGSHSLESQPSKSQPSKSQPSESQPSESPPVMTVPLIVLAILAILGGALELPTAHTTFLASWLAPVLKGLRPLHLSNSTRFGLEATDAVLALIGASAAALLWRKGTDRSALEPRFLLRGWGLDAIVEALVARPGRSLAGFAATKFDRGLIDGAVLGAARAIGAGGQQLRRLQSGYVRNYALTITFGAVLLLGYVITRSVLL